MTEFRTKGKGDNKKVYPINKRKLYTVDRNLTYEDLKNPSVTPSKLEKEAWNILDKISDYRYINRDRYMAEGYEILHKWYGILSRKLDYLNMLLPHNYTYTEGGEDGL